MLLLVTEDRRRHRPLLSALLARGIFVYVSSYETAEFYCESKDVGGVVLDCIAALTHGEQLCKDLRDLYPAELPIAALIAEGARPDMLADCLIRVNEGHEREILTFCHQNCGWSEKPLSLYHLTVGNNPTENRYMGRQLKLSQQAHTILRCICYRAPYVTSTDDLLSLCFPEQTKTADHLAMQIAKINHAAQEIDPRPLVINEYGKGYRLRDGIYICHKTHYMRQTAP